MEQEKKQAIALMRYSAIAPLIAGTQPECLFPYRFGKRDQSAGRFPSPLFSGNFGKMVSCLPEIRF